MDLLSGTDLRAFLDGSGPLSPAQALAAWYEPMHVAYTQESTRVIGVPGMRLVAQTRTRAGKRGEHPLVTIRSELAWGDPAAEA